MSQPKEKAIALTKKHISALNPVAIAQDTAVRNQFISKFAQMYQLPQAEAIRFYDRESDNFSRMVSQSEALRNCTPMSLYFAFMKVGALKLSFDNGRKPLVYLIPGRRNTGTKDNPVWINEVTAQPSPEGEKEVRINNGILKKVGQPHIVHEGDTFRVKLNKDTDEVEVMEYEDASKTNKIIASFIRLEEPDGTVVWKVFRPADWARWAVASNKKNWNKGANPLYSAGPDNQIDEGFLKGKTILHSFHGYKQVDFLYQQPEGFVPDKEASMKINPNYMDDLTVDTEFVEEKDEPTDDFTAEVQAEEPAKESVKIITNEDDDIFN